MTRLISSTELRDASDQLQDAWGCDCRDDPIKRLALDTLHHAELAIRAFEDAARARAACSMAAAIFCPAAVDEDEPARLRVGGAL